MSNKNEDGLESGQLVDFPTLMRVKRNKKVEENETKAEENEIPARKTSRKQKSSTAE
jgi:hypothetical protein